MPSPKKALYDVEAKLQRVLLFARRSRRCPDGDVIGVDGEVQRRNSFKEGG